MYSFENDRPIYLQIFELIGNDIISGKYACGQKLPSVRELSMMLKVNPNTLQKALAELEEKKLIVTERTNGKFVTTDKSLIASVRQELIQNRIKDFLSDMEKINADKAEIIKILTQNMKG
ncbi:MAG: GntR family transcriptional regulator [Clostridiales bacterium]|nr:GntR family transcriptional regulator [Candidatus Equinaster intestinalis]